jgi:hypothetical protein
LAPLDLPPQTTSPGRNKEPDRKPPIYFYADDGNHRAYFEVIG